MTKSTESSHTHKSSTKTNSSDVTSVDGIELIAVSKVEYQTLKGKVKKYKKIIHANKITISTTESSYTKEENANLDETLTTQ